MAGGPKETFKMLSVNEIHSCIVYNTARKKLSITTIVLLQTIMETRFGNILIIGKDTIPDMKLSVLSNHYICTSYLGWSIYRLLARKKLCIVIGAFFLKRLMF